MSDTTWRRVSVWLIVGLLALAAVLLKEIDTVLAAINDRGMRSYGSSVFTGVSMPPWKTEDLAAAIELWRTATEPGATAPQATGSASPSASQLPVTRLLAWHLGIDLVLFVAAYALLLVRLIRYVSVDGDGMKFALRTVGVLVALDVLETLVTGYVLVGGDLANTNVEWLGAVKILSALKWTAFTVVLITVAARWALPGGFTDAAGTLKGVGKVYRGESQPPGPALVRVASLVALFTALVAVPAGGPLDQFPDALRYLLDDAPVWPAILSAASVLLFSAAVVVAGFVATTSSPQRSSKDVLHNGWVVGAAAGLSIVLLAWKWGSDEPLSFVPLTSLFVVLGVVAAAALAGKRESSNGTDTSDGNGITTAWSYDKDERALWVGGVAGVVIVAAGLGLVRASFGPALLGLTPGALPWWWVTAIGAAITLLGGSVCQELVKWTHARPPARWVGARIVVFLSIGSAAVLTRVPEYTQHVGTIGVLGIAGAWLALILGGLTWLSRTRWPWSATRALGLGVHTPWLTLIIVWWLLASLINTEGVYHDVRVLSGIEGERHKTLQGAFTTWLGAQTGCRDAGEIPLVLVAAPGGGIRGAYWTASAMDRLFAGSDCAKKSLFAISGVSGGSVGVLTWMTSAAQGVVAKETVTRIADDRGLAAAVSGLLFRDLFQPFVGINTAWRDRAALLEDGWLESARHPTDAKTAPLHNRSDENSNGPLEPLRWSKIGEGMEWVPVLVMNASSVSDGCRVLMTNVRGLASDSSAADCLSDPLGRSQPAVVSASIDPLPVLQDRRTRQAAGMRAVTAALLSARFPIVTPSGAMLRCGGAPTTTSSKAKDCDQITYAVDGGYFENSGLMTLLQIWDAVELLVADHNRTQPNRRIVPWVVIVDNHYRSLAAAKNPRRTREVFVPVRTMTRNRLVSQPALEQMAAAAMGNAPSTCGTTTTSAAADEPGSGISPVVPGCVAVLAPRQRPAVAAPLGWVLSETTRSDLDRQLDGQVAPDGTATAAPLQALVGRLKPPPDKR
jgi:hypothetical protein